MIKREKYLQDLKDRMHNGLIKVITGIRRCGKSYLLFDIFKGFLLSEGVGENHIIEIQLDMKENAMLRDPDELLVYIKGHVHDLDD